MSYSWCYTTLSNFQSVISFIFSTQSSLSCNLPCFNHDKSYFTPCFILPSDQVHIKTSRNIITKIITFRSINFKKKYREACNKPWLYNHHPFNTKAKWQLPTPITVKSAQKNSMIIFYIVHLTLISSNLP